MAQKEKLRALMSIPAKNGRSAVKRGGTFEAEPQAARDFVRMGQAERVGGAAKPADTDQAAK